MFKITAKVPTRYQLNSISFFGRPDPVGDGSYRIEEVFQTYKEAVDYLNYRIDIYAAENGTEEEIEAMRQEAAGGSLTYDACTASIRDVQTIVIERV